MAVMDIVQLHELQWLLLCGPWPRRTTGPQILHVTATWIAASADARGEPSPSARRRRGGHPSAASFGIGAARICFSGILVPKWLHTETSGGDDVMTVRYDDAEEACKRPLLHCEVMLHVI